MSDGMSFRPWRDVNLGQVRNCVRKASGPSFRVSSERTVTASAFPGYLFITLDLARDRWRAVNGTIGVSRLVTGLELPIPVPNGVVETIMSYVDEHGIAHFERDLTPGQTVRIKEGPLSQAVGKLIRSNGQTRARVLLEIMGAKVETSLPKSSLEAF